MGNEFNGSDMAPHTVFIPVIKKIDTTTALEQVVLAAGHHPKMRLLHAYVMTVDAANDATAVLTIKHGANIAATVTGGGDAIGIVNELTIAEAYKDCSADDGIYVTTDGDATTGDSLFIAIYELIA